MNTHKHRGFTMIEVVVVFGMILMLFAVTSQSLFQGQQRTSLSETVNQLVRDIRQQQIRVMQGDSYGGALTDYSIHFESDRYVLYPGMVYSAANPDNIVILLDPSIRFSDIRLPDSTIDFARGSGDVRNYSDLEHAVTVTQIQTNSQMTVSFNSRGVVSVQ